MFTSAASATFDDEHPRDLRGHGERRHAAHASPRPGSLPSGVTLATNGTLSGTPAAGTTGSYPITIKATDANANTSTQSFTLTVATGTEHDGSGAGRGAALTGHDDLGRQRLVACRCDQCAVRDHRRLLQQVGDRHRDELGLRLLHLVEHDDRADGTYSCRAWSPTTTETPPTARGSRSPSTTPRRRPRCSSRRPGAVLSRARVPHWSVSQRLGQRVGEERAVRHHRRVVQQVGDRHGDSTRSTAYYSLEHDDRARWYLHPAEPGYRRSREHHLQHGRPSSSTTLRRRPRCSSRRPVHPHGTVPPSTPQRIGQRRDQERAVRDHRRVVQQVGDRHRDHDAYGYYYPWNTTTVPDGTYTLQSLATDEAGNTTYSAAITVKVSN